MDITPIVKTARTYALDLAERTLNSFWQGFVGVLVVTLPTSNWSDAKDIGVSAIGGGVAAAGALLKGVVAKVRGDANSASLVKSV